MFSRKLLKQTTLCLLTLLLLFALLPAGAETPAAAIRPGGRAVLRGAG